MSFLDLLRLLGPALLGVAAAAAFDAGLVRRGLLPPGWARQPWRRAAAFGLLAGIFWIGVFLPLETLGLDVGPQTLPDSIPKLFLLHGLLVLSLGLWLLLGYGPDLRRWAAQIGLRVEGGAAGIAGEVGIGLVAGVAAWLGVITVMITLAMLLALLLGEQVLPQRPPAVVPWMVGLPVGVRVALSLSAGMVEESFFRGFLQPRLGILASSAFFVLAHLSYQQPAMLVAVALLSFIYAGLLRWRQSLWAAMTAHALFDAVQLLVVIPAALEMLPDGGVPAGCLFFAGALP